MLNSLSKILFYAFFGVLVLSICASYYRFIVIHDYTVAYEGECDPYTQICFIGCEDDECTSEYYYSQMEKYAPNVFEQCGENITDCESAYVCLPEDGEKCSITLCNPEVDNKTCEELTEDDYTEETNTPEYSDIAPEENISQNDSEDVIETEELDGETNKIIENI